MTDRELLELAAKGAGIKVPTKEDYPYAYIDDRGVHRDISCGGDGTRMSHWNPLTDDGDALRLAVKLKLDVWWSHWPSGALYVAAHKVWHPNDSMYYDDGVAHGTDPYAATRRAIVRAAAEIGRGMK